MIHDLYNVKLTFFSAASFLVRTSLLSDQTNGKFHLSQCCHFFVPSRTAFTMLNCVFRLSCCLTQNIVSADCVSTSARISVIIIYYNHCRLLSIFSVINCYWLSFSGVWHSYSLTHTKCIIVLYCIVVGSRRLMPPNALQPKAYCTHPGL